MLKQILQLKYLQTLADV